MSSHLGNPMIKDVTEDEARFLDDGMCPDCKGDKFYEGPHGGMSVNVMCSGCKSEFNITPGIPGTFGKQRIGLSDNGGRT